MVDILLVEDNENLGDLILAFLRREGYSVFYSKNGEGALEFLKNSRAKLVILDIMLPGIDGFTVLSNIRNVSDIPVIIISAKINKEDKINGFSLGTDDYVEKPVDIDILTAKVKALMRRNYSLKSESKLVQAGGITIDREGMKVFLRGKSLALTTKEYELLLILVENAGKVLNKNFLFNKIWGADSFSENQTVTVHIKMLRDKIEEDPKNPKMILTIWGVGYKYEEL